MAIPHSTYLRGDSHLFLNESHLLIHWSFIPGAGWGLMMRPTPPPPGSPQCHHPCWGLCVPFCHWATPFSRTTPDYELSSTRRGSLVVFDPQVYDYRNIGRFVNQGGLMEGLKALVVYSPNMAESIFGARSSLLCGI